MKLMNVTFLPNWPSCLNAAELLYWLVSPAPPSAFRPSLKQQYCRHHLCPRLQILSSKESWACLSISLLLNFLFLSIFFFPQSISVRQKNKQSSCTGKNQPKSVSYAFAISTTKCKGGKWRQQFVDSSISELCCVFAAHWSANKSQNAIL